MNTVNVSVTMDELVVLWKLRHGDTDTASQAILRSEVREIPVKMATTRISSPAVPTSGKFQYRILGELRRAKSSIVAFLDILATLSSLEPNLPERLSLVAPASTRNHIARSPADVYPRRPDLGRKAREIAPSWYAGINIADREKRRILKLACDILRLQFGRDIVF